MTFEATERVVLAALADVLIPAGEGFLSASEAGVAAEGLDQLLSFRPDLAAGLRKLLRLARGHPAAQFLRELQTNDPPGFSFLAEIIPGAYFLNPQVRAKLGYHGQDPRPIDPRPDYLDDGLLQSVIDRSAIYRCTPSRGPR